jgi:BNR/Asp-box repeat
MAGVSWRAVVRTVCCLIALPLIAGCGASGHTATASTTASSTVLIISTPSPTQAFGAGWARVTSARWGDVQFSASDRQRGYLCGNDDTTGGVGRIFGVSTDGGQTWQIRPSPASYTTCGIQISPTDPLKVIVTSVNEPGEGQTAYLDAHYSSDGGQTWAQAPIPPQTLGPGGALWSGSNLFVMLRQSLQVSVNGGSFTSLDLRALGPGAQNINIMSAVASDSRIYLNLQYSDCANACTVIVASGDGGKTWSRIPNQSSILLDYIQGSTLYGTLITDRPAISGVMRSTDNGATWTRITFPALPGGATIVTDVVRPYVVAPDGTIACATVSAVVYLRSGVWTQVAYSSTPDDALWVTTFSLGANGQPDKVWGMDAGKQQGLYWHDL